MSIFQRCRRCKRPSSFASVSCFRFNSSTVRLLVWSMFSFPTGAIVAAFLNRREAQDPPTISIHLISYVRLLKQCQFSKDVAVQKTLLVRFGFLFSFQQFVNLSGQCFHFQLESLLLLF